MQHEVLRTATPSRELSRSERKLIEKQREKEEKDKKKQEKKRLKEDKKLDKLITERHTKLKRNSGKTSFWSLGLKKSDPHFSAGDKRVGALWDPKEQAKIKKREEKQKTNLEKKAS